MSANEHTIELFNMGFEEDNADGIDINVLQTAKLPEQ